MSLSNVHPITSSYEAMALKSTIDLTHNDMVCLATEGPGGGGGAGGCWR